MEQLQKDILIEFKNVLRLAPDDYTENCTNVVMSMVEKLLAQERAKADIAGRIEEASLPMHRYGFKYGNMPKSLADEITPFAMKRIAELKAKEL